MKKLASHTRRPLTLNDETIRRLSTDELRQPVGGTNYTEVTGCDTLFDGCTVRGGGPKQQ
jgi:hypothetical protein